MVLVVEASFASRRRSKFCSTRILIIHAIAIVLSHDGTSSWEHNKKNKCRVLYNVLYLIFLHSARTTRRLDVEVVRRRTNKNDK
jgi:hypothetical protein